MDSICASISNREGAGSWIDQVFTFFIYCSSFARIRFRASADPKDYILLAMKLKFNPRVI